MTTEDTEALYTF